MPGTRAEGIFEAKKYLAKGVGPQYNFLKRFGTPATKLRIPQNVFIPLFQFYSSFPTTDIEQQQQKKIQRV